MFEFLNVFLDNFGFRENLHVTFDSGGKHKPTIVLLHGIAATSTTWKPLIDELDTDKFRVIAFDLLGFGKSPKPNHCEYTPKDHVEYIRRTIKKLKVDKPFMLVGHSMGAIISAYYTSHYPGEINETYLLGLPLYIKDDNLHTNISRKHTDLYLKAFDFLSQNKDFTIKSSERFRKLLRVDDRLCVTEETWDGFRLSLRNTVIDQNTYDDIKKIKSPVHVIYGSLDEFSVKENTDKLTAFKNVDITKIQAVDHTVGSRFAKKVAQKING